MNLRRLWAIVIKELRQLRRDRVTAAMIVGIPTIQLLMFGFAINLDVRGLKAAIADQAHTSASRAVVQDMLATGVIVQKESAQTPDDLMQALKRGRISVGIVIPPDFERRLAENREAVQVLVDGSDISVQNAARQLAQMPLNGQNSLRPAQISVVSFYNPERRSAVNVVPGLVGVILTMTMILFTAVAIVRERERGNLELLITTPVSRTELMVGKVLPYIVIGLVQTTIVLLLG
ncbi:MAG TPA: ABC transporter permease, partial [Arenimonas sp.]|nr:ABC transporter permease [Arenimonas sp.]